MSELDDLRELIDDIARIMGVLPTHIAHEAERLVDAREEDRRLLAEARRIAADLLGMVNVMTCGERTFDRWQDHQKVIKGWPVLEPAEQAKQSSG